MDSAQKTAIEKKTLRRLTLIYACTVIGFGFLVLGIHSIYVGASSGNNTTSIIGACFFFMSLVVQQLANVVRINHLETELSKYQVQTLGLMKWRSKFEDGLIEVCAAQTSVEGQEPMRASLVIVEATAPWTDPDEKTPKKNS